MKRTILLFSLSLLAWTGAAIAGETKVMDTAGEAFIANGHGISRLTAGMKCEAGDMLMTRPGGTADVLVNGLAACRLLPGTTAALAGVHGDKMQILVAEGDVILNVKKLPETSRFLVDTPTAVAVVRGTQFWGRVAGIDEAIRTTFAVKEGVVRVTMKDSGAEVDLSAGDAVDIDPGVTELHARKATQEEMGAMRAADQMAGNM
ncbi:MAG: FecR domain-containing protein [Candidatus Omnitrophica bacterium]|nr:FecR domain-containing protein [Candidatus Omnitrophota bacterium]